MAVARTGLPATLGGWLIALVILACAILVILALVGVAAALPAWLPYLLIGLGLLGVLIP